MIHIGRLLAGLAIFAASDEGMAAPPQSGAGGAAATTAPSRSPAIAKPPSSPKVCQALKAAKLDGDGPPALSTYTTEPCATLARKHAAFIKQTVAPPAGGEADEWMREAFRCVPTHDGAWATTFDSLKLVDGQLSGKLALIRVDAKGQRLSSVVPAPVGSPSALAPTTPDNFHFKLSEAITSVTNLKVYDWDRDGQPEAFLGLMDAIHEGGTRRRAHIWTFRSGRVVEYEPASRLAPVAMWDADGDGRPDLLSPAPFVGVVTAGPGDYPAMGPLLLLHSLNDGKFTVADGLAKDVARCACPSRPDPFVLPSEIDAALTAVACAKIWRVETRAIVDTIDAACKGKDINPEAACKHGVLRDFARLTPEVRLP